MAKQKKQKKSRGKMLLLVPVWLALIAAFTIGAALQYNRYGEFAKEGQALEAERDKEHARTEELDKQSRYNSSDAYIEKEARDKLGYVKPDEFIFFNEAQN